MTHFSSSTKRYSAIFFRAVILLFFILIIGLSAASAQSLPGSGNSIPYNGFSSYVSCGTNNRGITQQVTVEAWIKTTSSAYQFIVSKYFNSLLEEKGFNLYISSGTAGFSGRIGAGVFMNSGQSFTRIDDGNWHHLTGVCNFSTWQIYVDGVLENMATYSAFQSDLTTSTALVFGSYVVQSGQYFSGEIDEVRVWRTARTQTEIRDNMCRKFAVAPAALVAYYRFDQSTGTSVTDYGAVPVTGTLVNISGSSWRTSGAPLGDASANLYQTALPVGSRVALATATGDSAIAATLSAQARGLQLYAVNSAPSIAPPGTVASSYVGVFTIAAIPNTPYSLRLRPTTGPACRNAFARTSNDLAWTLPAQLPATATSLLVQKLYRSEHILTAGVAASAAIVGDSLICAGTTTQLTVTAPGSTNIVWNTGATTATLPNAAPGTYTVTVTFGAGCAQVLRRTVRIAPAPAVTISGDSLLCAGSPGTSLTASAVGASAFRWNTGATTATLSGVGAGTYTVTTTFSSGCIAVTRRTIRLLPVPTLAISGDLVLCLGAPSTLTANAAGATAYRWSTGATTPAISVTQPGTYAVVATYGLGCTTTAQRTVQLSTAIAPAFTLGADTTLCEGDQLLLQGPAGTALRYQWSDGSTNRQLLVQTAGRYTLRVLAACGEQSASRTVAQRLCIRVPNIITVNADAHNDLFAVEGLRGEGWALDVYNRWGRSVFQATNYHNDWGLDAAPGIYYVVLRRPATGYQYKGWLEVLR